MCRIHHKYIIVEESASHTHFRPMIKRQHLTRHIVTHELYFYDKQLKCVWEAYSITISHQGLTLLKKEQDKYQINESALLFGALE